MQLASSLEFRQAWREGVRSVTSGLERQEAALGGAFIALMLACVGCSGADEPAPSRCVVPVGASPQRGPADAWVTIVEFADFQCRYCGEAEPTIRAVDAARPNLRWVFKHFPIPSIHQFALPAAKAAECAHAQGMFWEMHDVLFENQPRFDDAALASYAEGLGLDMQVWNACLVATETAERIAADYDLGLNVGVAGTPTFFINGAVLPGAYPARDFTELIDEAEAAARGTGLAPAGYYGSIERQGCEKL